jgi:hypothetical protein
MPQSSDMIAQIVEKLGMPIIAAVSEVERQKQAMGRVQGTPSDESQARLIAELLGKSTELGLMLFRSFDIHEPTESRADAARLGMTALSSSVVANLYGMTGRIPGDPELQRLEKVVQSVVAFSENFETGHDSAQALGAADSERSAALPVLDYIAVHYSAALIPIVNAVAAFPFGRQEEQLMKEIVQRLMGVAQGFSARLYASASPDQAKAVEVSILKVAANTYAQCHFAEMTQLMSSGDQQKMMAQNISMDGVWGAFDKRLGMLEAVVGSLVAQNTNIDAGSAGGVAPAVAPIAATSAAAPVAPPIAPVTPPVTPSVDVTAPPPVAAPAENVAPVQPVTQPAPVEPAPEAAAPAGDSSDPMSFFSGAPPINEE